MTQKQNQESSSRKSQVLHLRLTNKDWVDCFKSLTRAELGVFFYIRTLDPYGDRILDIDCGKVGESLGIHRTSVSRALEELKKKEFIDFEIEKARVRQKVSNRKLTLLTKVENTSNNEQEQEKEICASTHTSEHPRTISCAHAQSAAPTHTSERSCTQQPLQALAQNDSSAPHTIQTYSEFKKTLSDTERENFEKFVREEYYKDKGEKIKSFTAFMSNDHFQEWFERYQSRPEAVQATAAKKWQNHPQFENWLAEIERTGNPAMFALSDKEKQAFVKWCWETKQFSWLKEEGQ
jgi:DNA-binding MarR family transcriptional regulator